MNYQETKTAAPEIEIYYKTTVKAEERPKITQTNDVFRTFHCFFKKTDLTEHNEKDGG